MLSESEKEIVTKFDTSLREAYNNAVSNSAVVASLMGCPDVAERILKLKIAEKKKV